MLVFFSILVRFVCMLQLLINSVLLAPSPSAAAISDCFF